MLDHAGAMLVGGALVMLFSRLTLALLKRHAIGEARTQHYTPDARRRQSYLARAEDLVASMPTRLRYGLAMGGLGVVGSVVSFFASGMLSEYGGSTGSAVGRALLIAGKWMVIGAGLQQARKWGVTQLRDRRGLAAAPPPAARERDAKVK